MLLGSRNAFSRIGRQQSTNTGFTVQAFRCLLVRCAPLIYALISGKFVHSAVILIVGGLNQSIISYLIGNNY
jgi:hypothetical protein